MSALLAALDFIPKWLLLALLVGALGTSCVEKVKLDGSRRALADLTVAVEKQKVEAAALLASETAKVVATQTKLSNAHAKQETDDAINSKAISILADKLHAMRLRDPYAGGAGDCGAQNPTTAGAGVGAADDSSASGFLSERATEFLRSQASDADAVNNAFISCRADAFSLRELLK